MIGPLLALLWAAILLTAASVASADARRVRLWRSDPGGTLIPPRRVWGGERDRPPASWVLPRFAALLARMARSTGHVDESSPALRRGAAVGSSFALATGLTLVPFAGRWGGDPDGRVLVVLDLEAGLMALVLLLFVAAWAQVAMALSQASEWARVAAVRAAGRGLVGIALLVLALAALVVQAGSLRPGDLVFVQQGSFAPFAVLADLLADEPGGGAARDALEWLRLPRWHLFMQPLTALIFGLALVVLSRRPLAGDRHAGTVAITGIDLDDDGTCGHLTRVESRLASLLAASSFVALFLGGGAIPGVPASWIVDGLAPFVGRTVGAASAVAIESGVFAGKLALVLMGAVRLRRVVAAGDDDGWLRLSTRRLFPIAWANLLLVGAVGQLLTLRGGVS